MKSIVILLISFYCNLLYNQSIQLQKISDHNTLSDFFIHHKFKLQNEVFAFENNGHHIDVFTLDFTGPTFEYRSVTNTCIADDFTSQWKLTDPYLVFLTDNRIVVENWKTEEIFVINEALLEDEIITSLETYQSILSIKIQSKSYLYDLKGKNLISDYIGQVVYTNAKYIYVVYNNQLFRINVGNGAKNEIIPKLVKFPGESNFIDKFLILEVADNNNLAILNVETDSLYFVEKGLGDPFMVIKIENNKLELFSKNKNQGDEQFFLNIIDLDTKVIDTSLTIKAFDELPYPSPYYFINNKVFLSNNYNALYYYDLNEQKLNGPLTNTRISFKKRIDQYFVYIDTADIKYLYDLNKIETFKISNDISNAIGIVKYDSTGNLLLLNIENKGLEFISCSNKEISTSYSFPLQNPGLDISKIYSSGNNIFTAGKTKLQVLDKNEVGGIREIDMGKQIFGIVLSEDNKIYMFLESDSISANEPLWKDFAVYDFATNETEIIWNRYTYKMDLFFNRIKGEDDILLLSKGYYDLNKRILVKYDLELEWEVIGIQSGNYYYSWQRSDTSHPGSVYKQKIKAGSQKIWLSGYSTIFPLKGDVLYSIFNSYIYLIKNGQELEYKIPSFLKTGIKQVTGNEHYVVIQNIKNKLGILRYDFGDKVYLVDSIYLSPKDLVSEMIISQNVLFIHYSDSLNNSSLLAYDFQTKGFKRYEFTGDSKYLTIDSQYVFLYLHSDRKIIKLNFDLDLIKDNTTSIELTANGTINTTASDHNNLRYLYFQYDFRNNFYPMLLDKQDLSIHTLFECQHKNYYYDNNLLNAYEEEELYFFMFHNLERGYQFYTLNKFENTNMVINQSTMDSVLVSPNPATEIVTIESYNERTCKLIGIYDIAGIKHELAFNGKELEIGFLEAGMYFVKLTFDKQPMMLKFIKN